MSSQDPDLRVSVSSGSDNTTPRPTPHPHIKPIRTMATLSDTTGYGELEIHAPLPGGSVITDYEPSCLSSRRFENALTGCSSLFSRLVDNTGKCLGYRKPKNQQSLEDQEREDREKYGPIDSAHEESYEMYPDAMELQVDSVIFDSEGSDQDDRQEEPYADRRLPGENVPPRSPTARTSGESPGVSPTERKSGDIAGRPSIDGR